MVFKVIELFIDVGYKIKVVVEVVGILIGMLVIYVLNYVEFVDGCVVGIVIDDRVGCVVFLDVVRVFVVW